MKFFIVTVLLVLKTSVWSMKEEESTSKINIPNQMILKSENLQKETSPLDGLYDSKEEADARKKLLSQLRGTCLGAVMRHYNGCAACFWHVAEPCIKTLGVLLLGTAAVLTISIPIIEDPVTKNYCAAGTLLSGTLGGLLIKTGNKFSVEQGKEHIENYIALLPIEKESEQEERT